MLWTTREGKWCIIYPVPGILIVDTRAPLMAETSSVFRHELGICYG